MMALFIEILFIIVSFQVLRKPRDIMKAEIWKTSSVMFVIKWLFHMALLAIFWALRPWLSQAVLVFLALQVMEGSWLLISKESYFHWHDKVPEAVDKIFPLAYLLYFGYNLYLEFRMVL